MNTSEDISRIQTDARKALDNLQTALADLMAHVPGGIRRPVHLQQALGTDYKVSWQLFQIANAADSARASIHVPSTVLLRKLTKSAVEAGVPAKVASRVDQAVDEFNLVVDAYANDRPEFDAMLASLTGGEAAQTISIQHRRAAFRSDCPLWGIQAEMNLGQVFFRGARDGRGFDECYVIVKCGLRRLRQNVMPILHGFRRPPLDGLPINPTSAFIQESMALYGAPLLPQFCSQPIPQLLNVAAANGSEYSVLNSKELGRKAPATVAFSGVALGSPFVEDQGRRFAEAGMGMQITIPVKLAVIELFIHRPTFGGAAPVFSASAIGAEGVQLPEILRRARHLELYAEIESLGAVPQMEALPKVPKHMELVEFMFEKLGWDAAEFDVYRVQVPYPILHSELRLRNLFEVMP